MKKSLLILIPIIISIDARAQKGFYLMPSAGLGFVNSNVKPLSYSNTSDHTVRRKGLLRGNAAVYASYNFTKWRIRTGLHLLTTGFKLIHSRTGKYYEQQYNHLGISLQAGFDIHPENRFDMVPNIGMMASYNFDGPSLDTKHSSIMDPIYKDQYNRLSVWICFLFPFEYRLNNRLSFVAGPSLFYTINKFHKLSFLYGGDNENKRNYAINMDLGVKFKI